MRVLSKIWKSFLPSRSCRSCSTWAYQLHRNTDLIHYDQNALIRLPTIPSSRHKYYECPASGDSVLQAAGSSEPFIYRVKTIVALWLTLCYRSSSCYCCLPYRNYVIGISTPYNQLTLFQWFWIIFLILIAHLYFLFLFEDVNTEFDISSLIVNSIWNTKIYYLSMPSLSRLKRLSLLSSMQIKVIFKQLRTLYFGHPPTSRVMTTTNYLQINNSFSLSISYRTIFSPMMMIFHTKKMQF